MQISFVTSRAYGVTVTTELIGCTCKSKPKKHFSWADGAVGCTGPRVLALYVSAWPAHLLRQTAPAGVIISIARAFFANTKPQQWGGSLRCCAFAFDLHLEGAAFDAAFD